MDINHKYNVSEITNLVNDKKIVVLDFIIDGNSYHDYESDIIYPFYNVTFDGFSSLENIKTEYITYVRNYLNDYFTTYKLKNDLNLYISDVKDKLLSLDKYIDNMTTGYNLKIKSYNKICSITRGIKENKINKD